MTRFLNIRVNNDSTVAAMLLLFNFMPQSQGSGGLKALHGEVMVTPSRTKNLLSTARDIGR